MSPLSLSRGAGGILFSPPLGLSSFLTVLPFFNCSLSKDVVPVVSTASFSCPLIDLLFVYGSAFFQRQSSWVRTSPSFHQVGSIHWPLCFLRRVPPLFDVATTHHRIVPLVFVPALSKFALLVLPWWSSGLFCQLMVPQFVGFLGCLLLPLVKMVGSSPLFVVCPFGS